VDFCTTDFANAAIVVAALAHCVPQSLRVVGDPRDARALWGYRVDNGCSESTVRGIQRSSALSRRLDRERGYSGEQTVQALGRTGLWSFPGHRGSGERQQLLVVRRSGRARRAFGD